MYPNFKNKVDYNDRIVLLKKIVIFFIIQISYVILCYWHFFHTNFFNFIHSILSVLMFPIPIKITFVVKNHT